LKNMFQGFTIYLLTWNTFCRRIEVYQGTQPYIEEEKTAFQNINEQCQADRKHLVLIKNDDAILDLYPMYQLIENETTSFETHICFLKRYQKEGLFGESVQGAFEIKLNGLEDFQLLLLQTHKEGDSGIS
jgi:hypothetical protein